MGKKGRDMQVIIELHDYEYNFQSESDDGEIDVNENTIPTTNTPFTQDEIRRQVEDNGVDVVSDYAASDELQSCSSTYLFVNLTTFIKHYA